MAGIPGTVTRGAGRCLIPFAEIGFRLKNANGGPTQGDGTVASTAFEGRVSVEFIIAVT